MMSDKMKQRHDLNVANEGHNLQQEDAVWFHNPQRDSLQRYNVPGKAPMLLQKKSTTWSN